MTWLYFALLTVACWGVYGIFLHTGQMGMQDAQNGRYKAFLLVGFAYFVTAVVAPLVVLKMNGATMDYPMKGIVWSFIAGVVGAIGAFGVLLAFGAAPGVGPEKARYVPVVMSIIFAGAPIVNALVSFAIHPPKVAIPWQFFAGILLAALGGCLVTLFKPGGPPPKKSPTVEQAAAATTPPTHRHED